MISFGQTTGVEIGLAATGIFVGFLWAYALSTKRHAVELLRLRTELHSQRVTNELNQKFGDELIAQRQRLAEAEGQRIGEERFFNEDLTHVVEYFPKSEGSFFWESHSIVIEEQFVYRGLPIITRSREHVLGQRLDREALARAVTGLVSLGISASQIRSVVREVPGK